MKFCYCDESGTGDEPVAVMVSVIVDAQRMHKTKADWDDLLVTLSRTAGRPITELHTRDFYPGNGQWRDIDGPTRAKIITDILTWLNDRRHSVVFTAIKKDVFEAELAAGLVKPEIRNVWQALSIHLVLAIQKCHRREDRPKGHSLLIFDEHERDRDALTALILNPPAWTDSYYEKGRKEGRLDQIIDVPYWADSQHVGLIQLADFLAYFVRRFIELREGLDQVRYPGEDARLDEWFGLIVARQISRSCTLPSRGRCEVADFYWKMAPECLKN